MALDKLRHHAGCPLLGREAYVGSWTVTAAQGRTATVSFKVMEAKTSTLTFIPHNRCCVRSRIRRCLIGRSLDGQASLAGTLARSSRRNCHHRRARTSHRAVQLTNHLMVQVTTPQIVSVWPSLNTMSPKVGLAATSLTLRFLWAGRLAHCFSCDVEPTQPQPQPLPMKEGAMPTPAVRGRSEEGPSRRWTSRAMHRARLRRLLQGASSCLSSASSSATRIWLPVSSCSRSGVPRAS